MRLTFKFKIPAFLYPLFFPLGILIIMIHDPCPSLFLEPSEESQSKRETFPPHLFPLSEPLGETQ